VLKASLAGSDAGALPAQWFLVLWPNAHSSEKRQRQKCSVVNEDFKCATLLLVAGFSDSIVRPLLVGLVEVCRSVVERFASVGIDPRL